MTGPAMDRARHQPPSDAVVEWFDSHCHIQDTYLGGGTAGEGHDEGPHRGAHATALAAVMARASEAGVTRMVCVGTDADTSRQAVDLARAMGLPDSPATAEGIRVWATVGLHPHDAVNGVDSLDSLLATELVPSDPSPLVVGIGECGLDYHYDHSPRPVQREAFAAQIELAHRHGLALVVHTREAWDDTFDILAAIGVPERTVIHCFTGGPEEARRCLDLGASISFSGVVTFKTATEVREAVDLCPLDRLLVETDSPFLAPVPHRGSVNEPARVPVVGAAVAAQKGLTSVAVAAATTRNAVAAFGL
ncbi:MAG: TatD family hydrolase [Acidimicrobiales bacterium]